MHRLLLLAAGTLGLLTASCDSRPRTVAEVQLVTADLDHFWAAYPAAARDTAQAARLFQQQYFDLATPGLAYYYQQRYQNNAHRFARRISERPRYYGSLRPTSLAVAQQKPQILAAFRRLQALYPPTRFNNVYFLVGGFMGSTAQPPGLLIGVDCLTGPGVDTSELSLVERNRLCPAARLPALLTHELTHNVQQPNNGTLLGSAIREGMGDFVAELATGQPGTNGRLQAYGNAHERELWAAFKPAMLGYDTHNWLANPAQETPDRPCDLGYYVGYRICRAYYRRASDKKQAVAAMLTTKDFPGFLQQSGYEESLRGL